MVINSILVVCIGNICRSPMAVAILKEQYPQKQIESAGISAVVGSTADSKAIEVMAANGIDITDHIAQQVNETMVSKADLILTMSTSQTKWIEKQWPSCRGKIFRVGHWISKDIADPYMSDISAFETARQDILNSLEQWADKIS